MEAMREVSLAHYETLPEKEKAKIIDDYKKYGEVGLPRYVRSRGHADVEIIQDFLITRADHSEEEGLDFEDFVTLNYVLGDTIVRCNGCSSLLLGKAFFCCEECFFDYPIESYNLCCDCYGSRKFDDHIHNKFCNNLTLQYLSKKKFANVKRDGNSRKVFLEKIFLHVAGAFVEIAGDLKTNGWENILESYYYDREATLAEISSGVKKLEGMSDATRVMDSDDASSLTAKIHRIFDDLWGVEPSKKIKDEDEKYSNRFSISNLMGIKPTTLKRNGGAAETG